MAVKLKSKCFLLLLALTLIRCSNNKERSEVAADASIKTASVPYISQHSLTSFLHLCKTIIPNKGAKKPFNKLRYDKVIAYDYDGANGEHIFEIVESGKLVSRIKKQVQLSQIQVDDLTNLLGAPSTYGRGYAFCYEPHFGIVFYLDNKITAHISIAIGCNRLRSSIPILATSKNFIRIGKGYKYPAEGFSEMGSQKLVSLCKDLKFRVL